MAHRIETVDAARTHPLRQEVLRPGWSLEAVAALDRPATTFAALEEQSDEVLSTATVFEEGAPLVVPEPARERRRHFHLRFMATRADRRGEGLGGEVLQAVIEEIAAGGGGLLWCNARERAVGFYARAAFAAAGERFFEEGIGWHFVMWRIVAPASGTSGQR